MLDSGICEAIFNMTPLDVDVIDSHAHLGTVGQHYIPDLGSPEAVISMMDRIGVRGACVSHLLAAYEDVWEGNRLACEAASKYPGRFYVYLGYNPNYPVEHSRAHLEEYVSKSGVIGLKVHRSHEVFYDDSRYIPVFEFAREEDLPVLCHTWGIDDIVRLERVAKDFPDVKLIFGHSGGYDFSAIYEAVRVGKENENVYLDLTLSGYFEGLIEFFVKEVPIERILFGSDMPYFDPRGGLGRVAFARTTDEQKERILGGNMKDLCPVLST